MGTRRLRSLGWVAGALALVGCGDHLLPAGTGCEQGESGGALEEVEQPWLLAIDEDEGKLDALVQISLVPGAEGEVTVLCEELELPSELPGDTNFTSLAVHEGRLFASALRETWGDTLVEIDPCTCSVELVGDYGFTLVSGLASGPEGLLGVAAEGDWLMRVDPADASSSVLAALDADWGSNALSASVGGELAYGLDASEDRLYTLRVSDGAVLGSIALADPFLAAGLELHGEVGELYACGVEGLDRDLFVLDPLTGAAELVAAEVFMTRCDNLAAPSGPIACVSD